MSDKIYCPIRASNVTRIMAALLAGNHSNEDQAAVGREINDDKACLEDGCAMWREGEDYSYCGLAGKPS